VLGLRAAPEFEDWLVRVGIMDSSGGLADPALAQDAAERLLSYEGASG
jgi:hypothetical protein